MTPELAVFLLAIPDRFAFDANLCALKMHQLGELTNDDLASIKRENDEQEQRQKLAILLVNKTDQIVISFAIAIHQLAAEDLYLFLFYEVGRGPGVVDILDKTFMSKKSPKNERDQAFQCLKAYLSDSETRRLIDKRPKLVEALLRVAEKTNDFDIKFALNFQKPDIEATVKVVNLAESIRAAAGKIDTDRHNHICPNDLAGVFSKTSPADVFTSINSSGLSEVVDFHFCYWFSLGDCDLWTLTAIDVSFCPNISDTSVCSIAKNCPRLEKLDVTGCRLVTEISVFELCRSCSKLVSAIFDMTSVRYLSSQLPSAVSANGCPLILSDCKAETVVKSAQKATNKTKKAFTWAKVVIIKPAEMKSELLATSFFSLKPDHKTTVGVKSYALTYRSGPFRIVECVEDAPLRMLLSENCLVVLPFSSTGAKTELVAIESRLNLIASFICNFKVALVPVAHKAVETAAQCDDQSVDKLVDNLVQSIRQTVRKCGQLDLPYAATQRLATVSCQVESNVQQIKPSALLEWLGCNQPHASLFEAAPTIFEALNSSKCLQTPDQPFFVLETLSSKAKITSTTAKRSPCWPSIAQLLVETGNCWMESYAGFDGPPCSPAHLMTTLPIFINFINEFRLANDSMAVDENIRSLNETTPLCSHEHFRSLLGFKNNNNGLTDGQWKRVLTSFECAGLGIFREQNVLSFGAVHPEPPVEPSHFFPFIQQPNERTFYHVITYRVACRPSLLLPYLLPLLTRYLEPMLVWKTGAYFCECGFLDILLEVDDVIQRTVTLKFCSDLDASNEDARSGVEGSCSIIHTICSLVLSPFSNENLFELGDVVPKEIHFLPPSQLHHEFVEIGEKCRPTTFQRHFEGIRCSKCLLDVETVALLRRYWFGVTSNHHKPLSSKSFTRYIPLGHEDVSSFGIEIDQLPPFSIDVINVSGVKELTISPNSEKDNCVVLQFSHKDGLALIKEFGISETVCLDRQVQVIARWKVLGLPIPFGFQLEIRRSVEGIHVHISVGGSLICSTFVKCLTAPNYVSLVPEIDEELAKQNKVVFAIFTRVDASEAIFVPGETVQTVKVGAKLEAIDLATGADQVISVATVRKISTSKSTGNVTWLIHFDGQPEQRDYWAEPATSTDLFPCGFIEFLNSSPVNKKKFAGSSKGNFENGVFKLRSPNDSFVAFNSYFSWRKYLRAIKARTRIDAEPAPLGCFEASHLVGFPNDFLRHCVNENFVDVEPLTMRCSIGFRKIVSGANGSSQSPRNALFVPLPALNWKLCCWPSRKFLFASNGVAPRFLCNWPPLLHFVNDPSTPTSAIPAIQPVNWPVAAIADVMHRLSKQARFVPDECQYIFPNLVQAQPIASARTKAKTAAEMPKQGQIVENILRTIIFPYCLDNFAVKLLAGDSGVNPTTEDEWAHIPCVAAFEKSLQQANYAQLVLMPDAEKETFLAHRDCPRICCCEHAEHYVKYKRRRESKNRSCLYNDTDEIKIGTVEPVKHYNSLLTIFVQSPSQQNCREEFDTAKHSSVSSLCLDSCSLLQIPTGAIQLKWLAELDLRGNNLAALPEAFELLSTTLLSLDISLNKFEEIPEVVFKLGRLKSLRADYLRLKALHESVDGLSQLRLLSLRSNCLTELPNSFEKLSQSLETLDLSSLPLLSNQKTALSYDEFQQFLVANHYPNIESREIWSELVGKTFEKRSYLDGEAVDRLNGRLFKAIPRFVGEEFPPCLTYFTQLRRLDFSNQPIKDIPESIGNLFNLHQLDLSSCRNLEDISPAISKCPIDSLRLDDCNLLRTPPAEMRNNGTSCIMSFFSQLAAGSVTSNKVKLAFVGMSGCGKTLLLKALTNQTQPNRLPQTVLKQQAATTSGPMIDITECSFNEKDGLGVDFRYLKGADFIFLNILFLSSVLDFSGQAAYFAAQQFFLSSNRTIYVLAWNIRLGYENAGLDVWLNALASFAPRAPVIVVGTHLDKLPDIWSRMPKELLKARYRNIRHFHHVSNFTHQGISQLRLKITEVAHDMKHVGERIPRSFIVLEEELLKWKKDAAEELGDDEAKTTRGIVFVDEVRMIGERCGFATYSSLMEALHFLSTVGCSVKFFARDGLDDRVILDVPWLVDVLSKVLSAKDSPIHNGRLMYGDLSKLWSSVPEEHHEWLLKLVDALEFAYNDEKSNTAIVPCLISETEPVAMEAWPIYTEGLVMQIVWSFQRGVLPNDLFNRLQAHLCHLLSDERHIWRHSILLAKSGHVARIYQADSSASIHCEVRGSSPQNFLDLISEEVTTVIEEAFPGVSYGCAVSCSECFTEQVLDQSTIDLKLIGLAIARGAPCLQCPKNFHDLPTQKMLNLLPSLKLPIDENIDRMILFDCQLSEIASDLSQLASSIRYDVLIVGCLSDTLSSDGTHVTPDEIASDLAQSDSALQVGYLRDPSSMTPDELERVITAAKLVVYCVSPGFVMNENCKHSIEVRADNPLVIVFIREVDIKGTKINVANVVTLRFTKKSDYDPSRVTATVKLRREITCIDKSVSTLPEVFISYSTENSLAADQSGERGKGKIGYADPRKLKKILSENSVSSWIDVEHSDMTKWEHVSAVIKQSKVLVACVSNEYVSSEKCLRQFFYGAVSCRLPVVLVIVGNGDQWKHIRPEITLIAHCNKAIDFQKDIPTNYSKFLDAVLKALDDTNGRDVGNLAGKLLEPSPSLFSSFQQILELGQRTFLRKLRTMSDRFYPRLVFLDVFPKLEDAQKSQSSISGIGDDQLNKGWNWTVRFMCEHEAGWHVTDSPVAICEALIPPFLQKPSDLLRRSSSYLGRLYRLIRFLPPRYAPNLIASLQFSSVIEDIEKLAKFDAGDFANAYKLLCVVASEADKMETKGGLKRRQLSKRKDLWLCDRHFSNAQYRAFGLTFKSKHDISPEKHRGLTRMFRKEASVAIVPAADRFQQNSASKKTVVASQSTTCSVQ